MEKLKHQDMITVVNMAHAHEVRGSISSPGINIHKVKERNPGSFFFRWLK